MRGWRRNRGPRRFPTAGRPSSISRSDDLLSSLRSRIFLTSALLAVLSIGAAIYLVSVRVTRELEESLQREIRSTGELVEQLRTTRAQTFAMMARLIADAPTLKAAVDTNDPRDRAEQRDRSTRTS